MKKYDRIWLCIETGCLPFSDNAHYVLEIAPDEEEGDSLCSYADVVFNCTHDEVAYHALLQGLAISHMYTSGRVNVGTGSINLIKQMKGVEKIHGSKLVRLYCKARMLEEKFKEVIYEDYSD